MENSLGTVLIKPKGKWHKAMQKIGFAPSKVELYLDTFTSKKTYDIANALSNVKEVVSKDVDDVVSAISQHHPQMVDLIVLAASASPGVSHDILRRSIDEGWRPDEFVSAVQMIIGNIDYDSFFTVMASIGKLKVS